MLKSRASRFVWAVNGYLLLALLIFALGQVVLSSGLLRPKPEPFERGMIVGQAAQLSRALDIDVQHPEYETPSRVGNSSYFSSSVYVMDKNMPREVREAIASAGDISRDMIGARINILFFDEGTRTVNRLLPSFGYIDLADVPRGQSGRDGAVQHRQYIVYRIADRDTNGDGRINDSDDMAYYTSDLSGSNLQRVTPKGLRLETHWFSEDYSQIFFEQVEVEPGEFVPGTDYALRHRHIFVYDVDQGIFGSFDALQQEFNRLQEEFREG
jgi:hypothetical protein